MNNQDNKQQNSNQQSDIILEEQTSRTFKCNAPNCLNKGWCNTWCEASVVCLNIGKCGIKLADKYRRKLMIIGIGLLLISIILNSLALIALRTGRQELQSFAWGKSIINDYGNQQELYAGLNGMLYISEQNKTDIFIEWSQEQCQIKKCHDCKQNSQRITVSVILALVTCFPLLNISLIRLRKDTDKNCIKCLGIISSGISSISILVALINYMTMCLGQDIMKIQGQSLNINIYPWTGVYLILISTIFKVFISLFHILLPTPQQHCHQIIEDNPYDIDKSKPLKTSLNSQFYIEQDTE